MYKQYIENRVLEVARYMIITKDNIRNTAKKFGVSKSTIHKDISERLKFISLRLYGEIKEILPENKHNGQLKGGQVTGEKWKKQSIN